jgi:hypothetical protein
MGSRTVCRLGPPGRRFRLYVMHSALCLAEAFSYEGSSARVAGELRREVRPAATNDARTFNRDSRTTPTKTVQLPMNA